MFNIIVICVLFVPYMFKCYGVYRILGIAVVFIAVIYEIIDVYVTETTGFW